MYFLVDVFPSPNVAFKKEKYTSFGDHRQSEDEHENTDCDNRLRMLLFRFAQFRYSVENARDDGLDKTKL